MRKLCQFNFQMVVMAITFTSFVTCELTLPERLDYSIQEEQPAGSLIGSILLDINLHNIENEEQLQEPQFSFYTEPQVKLDLESSSGLLKTSEVIDREEICGSSDNCELLFIITVQSDRCRPK